MDKFVAGYLKLIVVLGRTFVAGFAATLMYAYVLHLFKRGDLNAPDLQLVWFSLLLLGGDWAFEKFVKYWRTKTGGNGK